MAPVGAKRPRGEDDARQPKKKIRIKKQKKYYSSSDDEDDDQPVVSDAPVKRAVAKESGPSKSILKQAHKASPPPQDGAVPASEEEGGADGADIDETEMNTALNAAPAEQDSDDDDDDDDDNGDPEAPARDAASTSESDLSDSDNPTSLTPTTGKKKNKRHDPTAFSTSMARILDTKLATSKRTDPVLSRSATASQAHNTLADARVEAAAKAQMRGEKRARLERGRERDVLGLESAEVETGAVQEGERRLKKVAQRGVVRLFNAVRMAQVRAGEGEELVRGEGVVGQGKRAERVGEMSKEGFLELISRGGGGATVA